MVMQCGRTGRMYVCRMCVLYVLKTAAHCLIYVRILDWYCMSRPCGRCYCIFDESCLSEVGVF